MIKLTPKQQVILEAITEFIEQHKYSPSMRELCEMVGITTVSTMYVHLGKLKAKGLITWEPSAPRTITILESEEIAV